MQKLRRTLLSICAHSHPLCLSLISIIHLFFSLSLHLSINFSNSKDFPAVRWHIPQFRYWLPYCHIDQDVFWMYNMILKKKKQKKPTSTRRRRRTNPGAAGGWSVIDHAASTQSVIIEQEMYYEHTPTTWENKYLSIYLKRTWLVWFWWVKMDSGDLTDVTLVTEEAF